jgi:glutamyl-tRNA reductase
MVDYNENPVRRERTGAAGMKDYVYIAVFGFNHNTAPVEIREKLYFSEEEVPNVSRNLMAESVNGVVILSTCNRTEIYFITSAIDDALARIKDTLTGYVKVNSDWLIDYAYTLTERDAYRHLFLVASGLDSMVIGEPQILGQVKDAYRMATFCNTTSPYLDKVFHRAFSVAKKIRTETRIGYNPVSISSVAVELSKKIFGDLKQRKILIIGAGEMCEVALKYFRKEGFSDVFVTNRTLEKAQRLAEENTGRPYPFSELPVLLTMVDVVISSTGAEKAIITKDLVLTSMKKRRNKPLFFIDIAVPRDVDEEVNGVENAYLYNIDDLLELSHKHLSDRQHESEKAYAIIEEEVDKFTHWLAQLDSTPLITQVFEKVESIRQQELRKTLRKFGRIDKETERQIDVLTKSIVNKLIHPHVALIRKNRSPLITEIMKKIFGFEGEDEKEMDNWNEGQ